MNDNYLDMDWTGNQGLSDSQLMNIASGCGFDVTIGANNGEEIRRAYNTLPWINYQEINEIDSTSPDSESDKGKEKNYLTFTALENSSIGIESTMPTPPSIQYSLDSGETWEDYVFGDEGTGLLELNSGDIVKFKGNNTSLFGDEFEDGMYTHFIMNDGSIEASGDVTSLLNGTGGDCELKDYCFVYLFAICDSLVTAPSLPSTTLKPGCYQSMFVGCTSLVEAPRLPATNLADFCYTTMFSGCTGLVEAPELPATTLAKNCYREMFQGCTRLVEAPVLSATNLADHCYRNMFERCTSLVEVPALPATNLADFCYSNMFQDCTSLEEVSELPATTLREGCYMSMFQGCTSLVEAPELLATTLANSCYQSMFQDCTSLTQAPELPATTLANNCYGSMFYGCTSLEEAPELPATTLTDFCYMSMFQGCTSLSYIKCLATNISATGCTTNWVNGVSGSGTFVRSLGMDSWTTGNNGIPTGWTEQDNV